MCHRKPVSTKLSQKGNTLFWPKPSQELGTKNCPNVKMISVFPSVTSQKQCVYSLKATLNFHRGLVKFMISPLPQLLSPVTAVISAGSPGPTQLFHAFQNKLSHSITPPLTSEILPHFALFTTTCLP